MDTNLIVSRTDAKKIELWYGDVIIGHLESVPEVAGFRVVSPHPLNTIPADGTLDITVQVEPPQPVAPVE